MVSVIAFASSLVAWLGLAAATTDPAVTNANVATNATTTTTDASVEYVPVLDTPYQLCGVDIVGGDFQNMKSGGPDNCLVLCMGTFPCNAATWTNYEGGTCWMKFIDTTTQSFSVKPNTGAGSFVMGLFLTWKDGFVHIFYPSQDFPGNDLRSAPGGRIEECVNMCLATTNCFAVTWSGYQGGTCWLKSRVSSPVVTGGVVSAIIVRKAKDFYACPGW